MGLGLGLGADRTMFARIFAVSCSLLLGFTPFSVRAAPEEPSSGCTNDMQCKGNRICAQGQCRDPSGPNTMSGASVAMGGSPGWSLTGSILGFVSAALVLGFGGASAATSDEDEQIPSLPLGIAGTVIGGVLIPIAESGANSADNGGVLGLKITGWIAYGLFLLNAMTLIGLGAAEVDADFVGPIVSTATLGGIASISMALDALFAYQNSSQPGLAHTQPERASPPGTPFHLRPYVGMIQTRDQSLVSVLGTSLMF